MNNVYVIGNKGYFVCNRVGVLNDYLGCEVFKTVGWVVVGDFKLCVKRLAFKRSGLRKRKFYNLVNAARSRLVLLDSFAGFVLEDKVVELVNLAVVGHLNFELLFLAVSGGNFHIYLLFAGVINRNFYAGGLGGIYRK